ncbi:hypothetical protein FFWV33_06265 [Flavobacterium faecale]|uniref:Uncharacterized protein n=1 Tax=Flavobacterium faecale TaxID=1355330 RepID=A0A2S1LC86_9FLAO|nr:hypothetical protein [Flavobacterium faecale]AWG21166.1 hypothetical protein FFWV33_06265 [Flavobacterium faecale]
MKKIGKILGLVLLIVILCTIGYGYFISKPLPKGVAGQEAELFTDKIQTAINQKAWDSTAAVTFEFAGDHKYLWDKKQHLVQVEWNDKKAVFNTATLEGIAFENDIEIIGEEKTELISKANDYFNNDSFWLIAPFKLRDPGTTRSIVLQDNQKALMVTYSSGGSTPGDSYVWLVDANFVPTAWRMWVSIIPVGGIETTWEDWNTYNNSLKIASTHKGLINLTLENIKTGQSIEEINNGQNPFSAL